MWLSSASMFIRKATQEGLMQRQYSMSISEGILTTPVIAPKPECVPVGLSKTGVNTDRYYHNALKIQIYEWNDEILCLI